MSGELSGSPGLDVAELEEQIRQLLLNEVLPECIEPLTSDADLFASGLTSLKMVQTVVAIEEFFSVEIPDEVLKREHFKTIATLTGFVASVLDDQTRR